MLKSIKESFVFWALLKSIKIVRVPPYGFYQNHWFSLISRRAVESVCPLSGCLEAVCSNAAWLVARVRNLRNRDVKAVCSSAAWLVARVGHLRCQKVRAISDPWPAISDPWPTISDPWPAISDVKKCERDAKSVCKKCERDAWRQKVCVTLDRFTAAWRACFFAFTGRIKHTWCVTTKSVWGWQKVCEVPRKYYPWRGLAPRSDALVTFECWCCQIWMDAWAIHCYNRWFLVESSSDRFD